MHKKCKIWYAKRIYKDTDYSGPREKFVGCLWSYKRGIHPTRAGGQHAAYTNPRILETDMLRGNVTVPTSKISIRVTGYKFYEDENSQFFIGLAQDDIEII